MRIQVMPWENPTLQPMRSVSILLAAYILSGIVSSNDVNVTAQLNWYPAGPSSCVLVRVMVRPEDQGEAVSHIIMTPCGQSMTAPSIYDEEVGEYIVGLMPIGVGGNLLTTWVSGSACQTLVYNFRDGHVRKVLSEGSRLLPPELIHTGKIGEHLIVFPKEEWVRQGGRYEAIEGRSEIYRWNGSAYDLVATIHRKDLLKTLKQLNVTTSRPLVIRRQSITH